MSTRDEERQIREMALCGGLTLVILVSVGIITHPDSITSTTIVMQEVMLFAVVALWWLRREIDRLDKAGVWLARARDRLEVSRLYRDAGNETFAREATAESDAAMAAALALLPKSLAKKWRQG